MKKYLILLLVLLVLSAIEVKSQGVSPNNCQEVSIGSFTTNPPYQFVDGFLYLDVCQGDEITFSATGSYPQNGTGYNQSDQTSTFIWYYGDGQIGMGANSDYSFDGESGYEVNLIIMDANGCKSTENLNLRVRVSTTPDFSDVLIEPDPQCSGYPIEFSGDVVAQKANMASGAKLAGITFLPDVPGGMTVSYTSDLNFNTFEQDAVIANPEDILSFCVNMEHSSLGDLSMYLECPNGTRVLIFDTEEESHATILGEPVASELPSDNNFWNTDPGIGYEYCWASSSTNGNVHDMSNWEALYGYIDPIGQVTENEIRRLLSGTYEIVGDWEDFIGCPLNGTWTVHITDHNFMDNGYIFSWGIGFDPNLYPIIWDYTPSIENLHWSGENITDASHPGGAIPSTSGELTYTLSATDNFGCTYNAEFPVMIEPSVEPLFENFGPYCVGETPQELPTTSLNGVTGTWVPSSINTSNQGTTSYTFTPNVTYCALGTTIEITVNPIPPANITVTNNVTTLTCANTESILVATGGDSYQWSNGVNTAENVVNNPGTYSVTVTGGNGCTNVTQITIYQDIDQPVVDIITDPGHGELGCDVLSVNLSTNTDGTFVWSTGSRNGSISVTNPGTYSVTVTGANGCTNSASINIIKSSEPPIANIINNSGITELDCNVISADLTATGGVSYEWSNGVSGADNTVTAPGNYVVTVTADNGCTSTASINITQNIELPEIDIEGDSDSNILDCNVTEIDLEARGDGSYEWSTGESGSGITVNNPGTYVVTATGENGCTSSASISIGQNIAAPGANIINNTNSTELNCNHPSISLEISGNGTFEWSHNVTGNSIIITSPGTYTVTVTGENGCTNTSTIVITEDFSTPVVNITNITGVDVLDCNTTSIDLNANGNGIFTWSTGETGPNISVTAPGTYTVTVTGANGCTNSASTVITQDISVPYVNIINNTGTTQLDCKVFEIRLTAEGDGTLRWNNGTSIADRIIYSPGIYSVTVTGANGCTNSASIEITKDITPPDLNIINNTGSTELSCDFPFIDLNAEISNGTLIWSNGITESQNIITEAGTYSVTVTGTNSCTNTASIDITGVVNYPDVTVRSAMGTTTLNCKITRINILAESPQNVTYEWSNGVTTSSQYIYDPGIYTVTVTDIHGCQKSASIEIIAEREVPIPEIINNTGTTVLDCNHSSISLTAAGGVYYTWDGNINSANLTVTNVGTYNVTVVGSNGCFNVASVTITNNYDLPIIDIVNVSDTSVLNCNILGINVRAQSEGTYVWSNGTTEAENVLTTPGQHTVTVTGLNGCTNTESINITQDIAVPNVNITNNTGTNTLDCNTLEIRLTADGDGTLLWNGGITTADRTIYSPRTYTVTVTGENGCTNSQSIVIDRDIDPTPVNIVNNTGTSVLDCNTTEINLTAVGIGTFVWDNGLTTANRTVDSPGTYTVTITGLNGCTNSTDITITRDIDLPSIVINNNTGTTVLDCNHNSISLTAEGGISYIWSNGPAVADNTILTDGTYIVTVTGPNGCQNTETVEITSDYAPPAAGITNNSNVTVLDCNNTTISLTATGGGTYQWSNGANSANIIVSEPNNYTVTVTGDNGCTSTESIIITQDVVPTPVTIVNHTGTTELDCNTLEIRLTAEGDGTFRWHDGMTSADRIIYSPRTFTVTITGDNGCTNSASITITRNVDPPAINITNHTGTTVLDCNNPSISLTAVSTGIYQWNNGVNTANNTITAPGNYRVTVTDSNGCTNVEEIDITDDFVQPTVVITNNPNTTVLNCYNPSINLTATGGAFYNWNNSISGATNTITSPGNYIVTVTGSNGCTSSENINITEDFIIPTVTLTNNTGISILDCNTTSISLTAQGGASYVWNNGITDANNNVNTPGTYTVTVTGANGCTQYESIQIGQDIAIPSASIINNTGITVLDCNNPLISLSAAGNGSYSWSNNTLLGDINVTTPGTYTLTVTGTNGCTNSAFIDITQNIDLPSIAITNNTGVVVLDCNNPSISLTASGSGTFQWSNGINTADNTITQPGIYTLTVTGANGCTISQSLEITRDVTAPLADITNNTGVNELDCANPSISLTADGGINYVWSNNIFAADNTVTVPGNYTVTVTGANGCTSTTDILITQDVNLPNVNIINNSGFTVLDCVNTEINLTATGNGTFEWNNGVDIADNTITTPGTYVVIVTGSNGCTNYTTIDISQNIDTPAISITNNTGVTEIDCNNPSISLTAVGNGTFEWNNGLNSANHTIFNPGTYDVTVTAANGCTNVTSIEITRDTLSPVINITSNSGSMVLDCNNPSIDLIATGGGTYSWNNNVYVAINTVSSPNLYIVTVTGANGCTNTEYVTVTQDFAVPYAAVSSITGTQVLDCSITEISLMAMGEGEYTWSNGSNSVINVISTPNTYSVTVTAANGCTNTASIDITQNMAAPLARIENNTGTITLDCNTSAIQVTATGGVSYQWPNGSTTPTNTIINPGIYVVTVVGANSCTSTASITINRPDPVSINVSATDILCNGETSTVIVTASGGVGQYYGHGTFENVIPGDYTYTVVDANGCQASSTITITEPERINISLDIQNHVSCYGGSNANVLANVTGGTGRYEYVWDVPVSPSSNRATGLPAGTWGVEVRDINNCRISQTFDIEQPDSIMMNFNVRQISCNGLQDGAIDLISVEGGVAPYITKVNGAVTTFPLPNLSVGTYNIVITDNNGCEVFDSYVIEQPSVLQLNLTPEMSDCGASGGTIIPTVLGGAGGYTYIWSNGSTDMNLENAAEGEYTLTVTDANGCSISRSEMIILNGSLNIEAQVVESVSCNGASDGVLSVRCLNCEDVEYYIEWDNGSTNHIVRNLESRTYNVVVTNSLGCKGTAHVVLPEPDGVEIIPTINSVKCNGNSTGSIEIAIAGGNSPYEAIWSNFEKGTSISGLKPGKYSVVVIDNNNCSVEREYEVTESTPIELVYNVKDVSCFDGTDGTIKMIASGGNGPYTYKLFKDSKYYSGIEHENLKAGFYSMEVRDSYGCKLLRDTVISQPEKLEVVHRILNPSCVGNNDGSIEMTIKGGVEPYLYEFNYLNHYGEPIIYGLKEGYYTIDVYDSNKCNVKLENVGLVDNFVDCLKIPNAFTPNGDGTNDTWIIDGIEDFPEATIHVFNKWGQQMFEAKGHDDNWDGKYKGNNVPAGTYVYIVMLHNGHDGYKGTVTVVY